MGKIFKMVLFMSVSILFIVIQDRQSVYAAEGVMKKLPADNPYGREYFEYYLVEDEADLRVIGTSSYPLDGNYLLANDIELDSYTPWEPITDLTAQGGKVYSEKASSFSGVFDGMGHTISNLWIKDNIDGKAGVNEVGFFRRLWGGTIRNILFDKVDIDGVSDGTLGKYVGSIAGAMRQESKIINCGILGGVIKGDSTGGIAGYVDGGIIT